MKNPFINNNNIYNNMKIIIYK